MIRYFYDTSNNIVGKTVYNKECIQEGVSTSIGYIDSEQDISMNDYIIQDNELVPKL